MSLEAYVKNLGDDETPLKHSGLLLLSGLSSEELAKFKASWTPLSTGRKYEILSKLVELCEDNMELDFAPVFHACLDDQDDEVREKATRGLWDCDDRVVIRPLITLLKKDPSVEVRATAAISLRRFAGMAQEGKLLSRDAEKIRETLLSLIADDNENLTVRRRAIETVASFNSSEIEEIIRQAYDNRDPRLRQSAIHAMGRTSDTRWLSIILDEMQHEDAAIRYEAANACGLLGDESTVPDLIRLIQDEDAQVQLSAVQALGAISGPLARQALLQCQKLGDEGLQEAAEDALTDIELNRDPLGFRFQV